MCLSADNLSDPDVIVSTILKVYYVNGETKLGIYAGRPRFTQVSESKAQADLAGL
jgi:hypothetical protein